MENKNRRIKGGKNMAKKKWFKPKKHTGWKKTQKASTRRSYLLSTTDKRKTLDNRYLIAGRRALALANVTKDKPTERLARLDAKYFFKKAKKLE
jgi:hypothetical protein